MDLEFDGSSPGYDGFELIFFIFGFILSYLIKIKTQTVQYTLVV